jgi:hypothetical protein
MKKKKQKSTKKNQNKIDEDEFLRIIDVITKKLGYKFKFGYHQIDDMKQQISVFALEGLKNYDYKRPLENFLWTHVRNRLFNYKRDNYQRPDKPCLTCPLYDPKLKSSISGCKQYDDKNDCDLYENWVSRNLTKKNLMYLSTIDEIKDFANTFTNNENNLLDSIGTSEILSLIETYLNGEERSIYIKLKSGTKVNKQDIKKLSLKIQQIIKDHG